jgi:hypothetical protein
MGADLEDKNDGLGVPHRPVRTRMPGGVRGGAGVNSTPLSRLRAGS